MGYRPVEEEVRPGSHLAYRSQQSFSHADPTQPFLELHWGLFVPHHLRHLPMDWFWQNSRAHQVGDFPVQILTTEANLLYLPAHLAYHHRFQGLRWFVDLALLVHRHQQGIDWDRVAATAQAFQLLVALRETFARLAAYWPSLPLSQPLSQLRALEPSPREAQLFHLLTAERRGPLLDFYVDILGLDGLPARARYLLLNLFPQRAYMVERYGAKRTWQIPFWYLYRMGDGLIKLGRTLPQALGLFGEPG
jgi:hypothetical protein